MTDSDSAISISLRLRSLLIYTLTFIAMGYAPQAWCQSSSVDSPAAIQQSATPVPVDRLFPIGVWLDGRVEGINCSEGYHDVPNDRDAARAYYDKVFTDMVNHGFNTVVIPNTPPDYRELLLDTADKVGIRVVLEVAEVAWPQFGGRYSIHHEDMITDESELRAYYGKIIPSMAKHPSLYAYQLVDEPQGKMFDRFMLLNRVFGEFDPAHPAFSCLCNEAELGNAHKMGTKMLIFDRYPFSAAVAPGTLDFSGQVSLLEQLRTTADKAGIPFWNVVQACSKPDGSLRFPTDAELQANIYLSLACNAKGIFLFLYDSQSQQERLEGLVDIDLNPQPLYAEAARLNGELTRLAPLLLTLKPADQPVSVESPIFGRAFTDGKGQRYLILVNLNTADAIEGHISLPAALAGPEAELRDVLRDERATFDEVDEDGTHSYAIHFEPGQGRVLKVNTKRK